MKSALGELSLAGDKIIGFENCDILRIQEYTQHYIASVCFHNIDESKSGLPLQQIVEERELGQIFLQKGTNLRKTLRIASWYFSGLCQFLVTSVLITVVLKIEWNGTSTSLSKCPWYIMLLFISSYMFAAVDDDYTFGWLIHLPMFRILDKFWNNLKKPAKLKKTKAQKVFNLRAVKSRLFIKLCDRVCLRQPERGVHLVERGERPKRS